MKEIELTSDTLSIYTNFAGSQVVIGLRVNTSRSFPSIVCDHIVFSVIIDLQLRNSISFEFKPEVKSKLYGNEHKFVIIRELPYYSLPLFSYQFW